MQLPPTLNGRLVEFCLNCVFQLRRFKTFKTDALTSYYTVEHIFKQRAAKASVENASIKTEDASLAVVPKTSEANLPQSTLRSDFVPDRIRTRRQTIRLVNDSVEIGLKSYKENDWKKKFEEIVKNQPKVILECVKVASHNLKPSRKPPTTPPIEPPQLIVQNHIERPTPSTSALTPFVTIHEIDLTLPPSRSPSLDPTYDPEQYCSVCKIVVTSTFSKHIMDFHFCKTENNQFQCLVCGFISRSRWFSTAVKHFDTHKQYEKVKKCEECGLVFTRFRQYTRHCATYHTLKHTCDYCFAKFAQRQHWMTHIIENHPENVQCLHCGEILEDKTAYFQHISVQHKNHEGMTTKKQNHHTSNANEFVLHDLVDFNRYNPNSDLLSEDELQTMDIPLLENM